MKTELTAPAPLDRVNSEGKHTNRYGDVCQYQTVEEFIAARIEPINNTAQLYKCRKDIGTGREFFHSIHPFDQGTPERITLYAALKRKATSMGYEWRTSGRPGYCLI